MPDTLVSFTEPTTRASKPRCTKPTACAKAGKSKAAVACESQAGSTSSISALAAATAASVLPSVIFSEADWIEIGTRRAKTSLDVVWSVLDDVSDLGGKLTDAGDDRLESLAARLYLLLGIVSDELKSARHHADKIADAARELKSPMPAQPLGTGDDLLTLRIQLKAAEDALNAIDNDEPPLADAYLEANERFLDAPTRTPSDVLLKLERLADLGDMASGPQTSTNRIVLNLIRDLRGALGINGQVQ